ncbi:hypothetical protein EJ08DRAFT_699584 [Tothia fuscella]|uniref:Uncharacterized protein n=1 Tax=Tothia fuscella TaxID=1048955 RepID=A0A9P4TWN6_9PEZI|nr:hypothetical protein EJ08DRAFT_699584 [Tothia fuscella]
MAEIIDPRQLDDSLALSEPQNTIDTSVLDLPIGTDVGGFRLERLPFRARLRIFDLLAPDEIVITQQSHDIVMLLQELNINTPTATNSSPAFVENGLNDLNHVPDALLSQLRTITLGLNLAEFNQLHDTLSPVLERLAAFSPRRNVKDLEFSLTQTGRFRPGKLHGGYWPKFRLNCSGFVGLDILVVVSESSRSCNFNARDMRRMPRRVDRINSLISQKPFHAENVRVNFVLILPVELREQIYSYLLPPRIPTCTTKEVWVSPNSLRRPALPDLSLFADGIFMVSRQIREEALACVVRLVPLELSDMPTTNSTINAQKRLAHDLKKGTPVMISEGKWKDDGLGLGGLVGGPVGFEKVGVFEVVYQLHQGKKRLHICIDVTVDYVVLPGQNGIDHQGKQVSKAKEKAIAVVQSDLQSTIDSMSRT